MRQAVVDLSAQPIQNLLINPTFAVGLTGWQENAGRSLAAVGGVAQARNTGATASLNVRTATATPIPVVPGTFYTFSAHVAVTEPAIRWQVQMQWLDSALATLGTPNGGFAAGGVGEERRSVTAVAPQGAAYVRCWVQASDVPVDPAHGINVDRCMLTAGTALHTYADGDTPGWRWTDEVGASPSVGYPWALDSKIIRQQIRNLARNPSFEFGTNYIGTANGATISRVPAAAIKGLQGIRVTCPANGISDSGVGIATQPGSAQPRDTLIPGRTYTYSVYVRAVTAGRVCMYVTGRYGSSSSRIYTPNLAAGEVYRLSITQVATAITSGDWWVLRDGGDSESIYDIDGVMITEGDTLHEYSDGTTPGWSWAGAAHGSESFGYPYTLESIAGKPLYFDENIPANGSYTTGTVFTTTSPDPMTIVATQLYPPSPVGAPGSWELNALGVPTLRRMIVTSAGSYGYNFGRKQTDGSWQTAHILGKDPSTLRTHVTLMGSTSMSIYMDGQPAGSAFPEASTIYPLVAGARLVVGGRDSGTQATSPITYGMAVYSGELDDETVKRITAWFARKYGSPIPAGY